MYLLQLRILKKIVPNNVRNRFKNDYEQLFDFYKIIPIHKKLKLTLLTEEYFNEYLQKYKTHGIKTRTGDNAKLLLPRYTNLYGRRDLKYIVPFLINELPKSVKTSLTKVNIKSKLKQHFLQI